MKNNSITFWWFLSLLFPLIIVWMPFFSRNLEGDILVEESITADIASLFVTAPFVFLALWSKSKFKKEGELNKNAIITSGLVAVVIPYFIFTIWFLYDIFMVKTGGANIGAGIIMLFAPVLLPLFTVVLYKIIHNK